MAFGFADEDQRVAVALERQIDGFRRVCDQPDAADHRGRQDRAAAGLVVKSDTLPDTDRVIEREAGGAHPGDGAGELGMISGRSGLPKFMLSVSAKGSAPTAGQVAPAFRDGLHAAALGIGAAIAGRAVGRQRQRLWAVADPHNRGVAARPA